LLCKEGITVLKYSRVSINKYGASRFRLRTGSLRLIDRTQISPQAFDAANRCATVLRLLGRFQFKFRQSATAIYVKNGRLRAEFLHLCGFAEASPPDVIFAASGTDAHLLAAHLAAALAQQAQARCA